MNTFLSQRDKKFFLKNMEATSDDRSMENIYQKVCDLFNVESLRSYQKDALQVLFKGSDCFVAQPTGTGKSLVFQAVPFLFSWTEDQNVKPDEITKSVLVISPLISLMKDQAKTLSENGLKAIYLSGDGSCDTQGILDGKFNIIFTSPETILTRHRSLFKSKRFRESLVTIAIDESHCIKKWGSSGKQIAAFRDHYNRISEIRSLTSRRIPILTLTATATSSTQKYIVDNLCLENPVFITSSPQKKNIKYHVLNLPPKTELESLFKNIIDDLNENGYKAKRVITFCRSMKDVRQIFQLFNEKFRSEYSTYDTRPYGMFHSKTQNDIKDYILSEFLVPDGKVRFLVATIAFGMGVNCKNLDTVLHFGPSNDLDDYFQESGRGGREGQDTDAILINYPKCLASKNISKDMKEYCCNETVCRRKLLMRQFNAEAINYNDIVLHRCCDICAKLCKCNVSGCTYQLIPPCVSFSPTKATSQKEEPYNDLSKHMKQQLYTELTVIRNRYVRHVGNSLCGVDIVSGFPQASINEIIDIASPNINEETLRKETSIINTDVYPEIIDVLKKVFENNADDSDEYCSNSDEVSDESEDNSSSSECHTDDETDFTVLRNTYHAKIESDSDSSL